MNAKIWGRGIPSKLKDPLWVVLALVRGGIDRIKVH